MAGGRDDWTDVAAFLRAQRQLANLSLRSLARLTNVSDSYLSQVERGLHQPSPEVLGAMARALGIPATSLYARVGWLDAADEPVADAPVDAPLAGDIVAGNGVEGAIANDRRLTAAQKSALTGMYRTLVDGS